MRTTWPAPHSAPFRFAALAALAVALLAGPAPAQDPLGPEDFDSLTQGKVFDFYRDGTRFGTEHYLPGREVIWKFNDAPCKRGAWYPAQGRICFIYEDAIAAQCWVFRETPGGMSARFADDADAADYTARERDGPMLCPGPQVGV